jgi:hypothetical protein
VGREVGRGIPAGWDHGVRQQVCGLAIEQPRLPHERALPSVLSPDRRPPHPRGARRRWANTGPISLSNYGVTWRFLAAPSSSDGASSDRFEQAWEGSIPFLGTVALSIAAALLLEGLVVPREPYDEATDFERIAPRVARRGPLAPPGRL